jgi:hypothetical protein
MTTMPYEDPGTAMVQAADMIARAIEGTTAVLQRYVRVMERREDRIDKMEAAAEAAAGAFAEPSRFSPPAREFLRRNARNMEDYRGRNPHLGNVEPFPKID